jgi:thiamine-phosphate pyrophosphorylase
MPSRLLLYYITDRNAFPGDESARRRRVLEKIGEAARVGVDYIQLREKDLTGRELESLAREAVRLVVQLRTENSDVKTALLINSRVDVALAVGADGVHLRSDDVTPREVESIWESADGTPMLRTPRSVGEPPPCGAGTHVRESYPQSPLTGVSCHSPEEVADAAAGGAGFAVFAPVFEKVTREKSHASEALPTGLAELERACRAAIPVLALGGVTIANARSCLEAGAAGIAAIRLFQDNDIAQVVRALRPLARETRNP